MVSVFLTQYKLRYVNTIDDDHLNLSYVADNSLKLSSKGWTLFDIPKKINPRRFMRMWLEADECL